MGREERLNRTFCNLSSSGIAHLRDEGSDSGIRVDKSDGLRIRSNGLEKTDGVRIDSFGVLGEIADVVWNGEAEPMEITDLLEERDDLLIEVDGELESSSLRTILEIEDSTGDESGEVSTGDVGEPAVEDGLGLELASEAVALLLQLLPFGVKSPPISEHVLDSLHVRRELSFDLTSPDDRSGDGRKISKLRHEIRFRILVRFLESVVEETNVGFDGSNELFLILGDGTYISQRQYRLQSRRDATHLESWVGRIER